MNNLSFVLAVSRSASGRKPSCRGCCMRSEPPETNVGRREFIRSLVLVSPFLVFKAPALAEDESMSLKEFYKALADGKVERVEFVGALYEKAYAFIDGRKVFIGEGYPRESFTSPISPTQVMAKVRDSGVPWSTAFTYERKKKSE